MGCLPPTPSLSAHLVAEGAGDTFPDRATPSTAPPQTWGRSLRPPEAPNKFLLQHLAFGMRAPPSTARGRSLPFAAGAWKAQRTGVPTWTAMRGAIKCLGNGHATKLYVCKVKLGLHHSQSGRSRHADHISCSISTMSSARRSDRNPTNCPTCTGTRGVHKSHASGMSLHAP